MLIARFANGNSCDHGIERDVAPVTERTSESHYWKTPGENRKSALSARACRYYINDNDNKRVKNNSMLTFIQTLHKSSFCHSPLNRE